VQLGLTHRALQAEHQPIVEVGPENRSRRRRRSKCRSTRKIQQLIPIGVAAGESADLDAEHDPDPTLGDQILETLPGRGVGPIPGWLKQQAPPTLGCTVYQARLRDLRDHHVALLDPNEMERRSQFTNRDDRDRFTRGAVLLRLAVASLTGCDASTVPVSRTCDACGRQHGRPRLPGTRLHASVSHSSELVVVAATPAGPVGVDVEKIGGPPSRRLLSSVCTAEEQAFVLTPKDFYTHWVRKEAILKATGDGLRRKMTDLVVTPPNRSPSLVFLDEDSTPPVRWQPSTWTDTQEPLR